MIRPPEECEIFLSDLIRGFQELGHRAVLGSSDYKELLQKLLRNSPYQTRSFPMGRILAALNFVDRNGRPSARLLAIWATSNPPARRGRETRVFETRAVADTHAVIGEAAEGREDLDRQHGDGRKGLPPALIDPSPGDFPKEGDTIFIGNLPLEFDKRALEEILGRFGTVTSLKLPIDLYTGKLRGFGFAKYSATTEAQAALNGIKGVMLGARKLRVAPAKTQGWQRG